MMWYGIPFCFFAVTSLGWESETRLFEVDADMSVEADMKIAFSVERDLPFANETLKLPYSDFLMTYTKYVSTTCSSGPS
jgi:hypothetical protein